MRIGIDVRCLAEGRRTGVEEYTIGLLKSFIHSAENHHFVLFFNSWKGQPHLLGHFAEHSNVTLKAYKIPNKLLNFCLWYLRWPRLDRLMGRVDVVFAPNQNFISVSRDVPLVITAHDLSFELYPETFSWKQRLWHFLVDFRRLTHKAERVIAVSRSTKDDLVDSYGLAPEKIEVVHSGYDERCQPLDRNDPNLLEIQKRYKLPFKFILSFATFEPRKNLLSVIEAYEELVKQGGEAAKYHLVLAGSPGWERRELYHRVRTSPARDAIHLIGFVAEADKPALYGLASVLVYPSLYEGFGFPPLEAMACGVPVIVSHSSSLPEIVGDAGILIDPYRPQELLDALSALLTDRELSKSLSEKGRARAREFSWEKAAEETLRILEAAAKQ